MSFKTISIVIITIFAANLSELYSQVGPANLEQFTGQGVGGSLFAKMRNVKDIKSDLPTVGSVYIDDNFKPCKIYYNEEFVGDFYYRHNAFNDEIEIKDTPNAPEEEISSLMAMRQLTLIDNENGSKLALHVYSNKDENLRNGYLYLLKPGAKYSLYFKNNVKFTEGTHPVTSLTRPTPNKFSHFVEYYVKTTGVETAKYISKKTGDFLRVLEPENRAIAKDYVKNEKLNLKDEADITKLFDHLNSL